MLSPCEVYNVIYNTRRENMILRITIIGLLAGVIGTGLGGIISALLVFLAAKNDYRKTYIASYQESNATRLRIADHLRKLPMSFFNTKDLSELTTSLRNR